MEHRVCRERRVQRRISGCERIAATFFYNYLTQLFGVQYCKNARNQRVAGASYAVGVMLHEVRKVSVPSFFVVVCMVLGFGSWEVVYFSTVLCLLALGPLKCGSSLF